MSEKNDEAPAEADESPIKSPSVMEEAADEEENEQEQSKSFKN